MSGYNKRMFKGRFVLEESESLKPSSCDDLDRECFLFQDGTYKPEYLQMPIKIEGDLRQRPKNQEQQEIRHQSSNESSQQLDNLDIFHETTEKNFPVDNLKDEYEELLNHHNRMDLIDSLLLHSLDGYHIPAEINQYYLLEPNEVKEEESSPLHKLLPSAQNGQISVLQQKRTAILSLINTFRSFGQAINIAMNYHKLTKKDSLNKAHSNVFNVLTKESRKLQAQLDTQYARFSALIDIEEKSDPQGRQKLAFSNFGMNKQLASTSIGHEPTPVKIQEQGSLKMQK